MKKVLATLLFFAAITLYANDFKWDFVNALTKNDYSAAEKIINDNIGKSTAAEKFLMINFTLTYSRGDTALHVLSLLNKHDVRPGPFDLYTAINKNQPDSVVYFIINQGVQANGEILLLAMEKQRFDIARHFIQSGADVNYQYPSNKNYADGMTALLHASKSGNLELVRMLVDRGAGINISDKTGNTALSYAQENGNTQIYEFLLERGANLNFTNNFTRQQQSGGIGSFFDAKTFQFKPGNYRLSRTGGDYRDLRFSGTASYGIIGYFRNDRAYSGTYQSANGSLTVIMDGRLFTYKIDSENSFSGSGEVWQRTGD
ncbi:MAG: ankyrin repeat domain-containing protein [Treponema sp.]|nr:ankyrin repeat domain-containing protein [Treponema sp.]